MAAADQLAEKLDRLEQGTDEKAERIRKTFHRQSEAIDPDLTELARKQRIGELHEQAERKLQAAREEHEAELARLVESARRQAFGSAPSDGAKLVAWRDAASRAAAIDNKQDAERELRRVLGSGDTQMVRALSRLAHERGWAGVAAIGVDRELLNELFRLEQLTATRGRRNIKQRMFRWRL